jgi:hypothetical protein
LGIEEGPLEDPEAPSTGSTVSCLWDQSGSPGRQGGNGVHDSAIKSHFAFEDLPVSKPWQHPKAKQPVAPRLLLQGRQRLQLHERSE